MLDLAPSTHIKIDTTFPSNPTYHQRAIVEYGYMSLYFNARRVMLVLEENKTGEIPQAALRLPLPSDWPNLYVSCSTTIDDLARAVGLHSYDLALPYSWVESEYLVRGLPFPRGCWCYDRNRHFGEFVSLADMLQMLASALAALGVTYVFQYGAPSTQHPTEEVAP